MKTNNNSYNNSDNFENEKFTKSFYQVIHNKVIFNTILSYINQSYHCKYSCIPLHSLNYLIDNNLIDIIKERVLNGKQLIINSNCDKKKILKHKKLFMAISSIKDISFYKNLFTKYLNHFVKYDFDKLVEAIYETDNSIAMSVLLKTMYGVIYQNKLYPIGKIAYKFSDYITNYHGLKVSILILKMFYNHEENSESYLKQKNEKNLIPTTSVYENYGNMKVNISSHSNDKVLNQDLIWNSIMNSIGKDKEIQLLEQQQLLSTNSGTGNINSLSNNTLDWSIINKKYYKFINTIVNELNIPPPIQNFKFFSPENWRGLMSTLFSQCPFESNYKVKWLLEACKAIHSITFYVHEKECIEISKKNGGGILRINYILNKAQLSEMVFTHYELNQRLNEIDLLNISNSKVVKLLRSYLEVSRLSILYSKNVHYYSIFGNDDFQTISLSKSSANNNSNSNNNNSSNNNTTTDNSIKINKFLIINSFKYAKYELLNEYLLKSNEKEPANYIITTTQEELQKYKNPHLLFKHNNNLELQIDFIRELVKSNTFNAHFIFSLIISTNNLNLINESFEMLKELLKSSNTNTNNKPTLFSNYKNLLLYTTSPQVLLHLYNLFNDQPQNYNISELLNYQIFYFNGRLDLLVLFEQLNGGNGKLKMVSPKQLNIKLNSKQFESYLSACKYVLERPDIYEINLSHLKDTVLSSNYCKERFTTSKDIENIKFIIEATKESYKPLELVSHSSGAINLAIAKFYSWLLTERSEDFNNGRCQLSKSEFKLIQYYSNTLQLFKVPYNQFIQDSKLVLEAIGSCGDFNSFIIIVNDIIKAAGKQIDQDIIKSFVQHGDDRIVSLFNFENKYYNSQLVRLASFNDHLYIMVRVALAARIKESKLKSRSHTNKFSTLDYDKLYSEVFSSDFLYYYYNN